MRTKASGLLGVPMERQSKSICALVLLSFPPLLPTVFDRMLIPLHSAFFHKKAFGGYGEPYAGQAVSFVFEEGPKGAVATEVKEEAGGVAAPVEDEGVREMGTVKVRITWPVPDRSWKAMLLLEVLR